jgi:hypothetical protein
MPRELNRVKPQLEEDTDHPGGTEEFAPKAERVTKEVEPSIPRGWASAQRPRSTFNGPRITKENRFDLAADGEEVLIKFLDDIPFAGIYQHWVMTQGGRRAYTCAGFDDCPMCARGDKAKSADYFNLVVLGDTPELKVWIMSPDPAKVAEEKAKSKKGPLNRDGMYMAVSKVKGSYSIPAVSMDWVREDELEADWGVKPLTDEQLNQFNSKVFDSSVVRVHTIAELQEAARLLSDD